MLTQNHDLISQLGASLTQINNIKSRLSRSVTSKNASKLLLKFGGFGGNFYYLIGLEIDKKIVSVLFADTKLVEFRNLDMDSNNPKNKSSKNHSHYNTECRYCKRNTVIYSIGKGIHSLRADCRSCRRWWWVGKIEATILIESGILQNIHNSNGKQLSLFGGECDA